MNFAQLNYVIAIQQHKNFSKAAFECNVTQATLSAMVKKLETELGFMIFDRTKQPIEVTEEGIQLIEQAKKILQLKNEIKEINQNDILDLQGTLRLGIIPTIASSLISLILPDLLKENPRLKLELKEITTEQIKRELKTNQIDLAIAATPLDEEDFEEEILYYEPMLIYGNIDPKKEYISTEEITEQKIWLLEEGHCFRNQVVTLCEMQKSHRQNDNVIFQANSFETLIQLVEKLGGNTLIPELYYLNLSEEAKLKCKYFQAPIPVREVSLISSRMHTKRKTISFLKTFITDRINLLLSTKKYKNNELNIIGI